MKRIFAVATLVAAFATTTAIAADTNTVPVSIEKQMRDLKKQVGAGEISSKEYNKRVSALRDGAAQQTAETPKK
jgi:uncharacterized membrane protein